MSLDFRNTNTLWASIITETLKRLGLTTAIICPGSRSTPLTIAFAQEKQIETIPILDERSAAFFALGIAKKTNLPVALICTSGTAGANFYPAIIEAKESRIPLLIFTADRPPELRDCHSGQTINQVKMYGNYPNWQTELATPSLEISILNYLRQTIVYGWERSLFPTPGPVHFNIPFRDPLAPVPDHNSNYLKSQFSLKNFFDYIQKTQQELPKYASFSILHHFQEWRNTERIIIVCGTASPSFPQEYCQAISHLSQTLKAPVLAEGLSPLRNYNQLNPYLIATYDLILRNQQIAQQLTPEIVIQIGDLPTSKELRTWLETTQPKRWIIDPSHHNFDPLHGKTTHLRISIEQLVNHCQLEANFNSKYLQIWCDIEAKIRQKINQEMTAKENLFESKVAWLIPQTLPTETPIFIANSMPVRDVEFFWQPNNSRIQPFFNRGANGIDGTLSTALGIAHRQKSSVMLTGDLALLHDTNGFLLRKKFIGHLTIILINNNGGGIFEMLPVSKFEPPFEEYFATPQDIDFAQLCATYNVEYELINSWQHLQQRLNPLPEKGIRVLEIQTNRKADAKWRQENLGKFAKGIDSREVL
ncbi:2-succinyl-5-enolpyruvyl-6-hydroxy-3-cyclohexene-1-carboxylic-acid synthase [Phormidium sp. LEGE 05292]|uniref:2-succinyl-5-enolpyruvyl-6-hydroxy-3- cyclohexene-1-carboxylic-acid synthase n=1 Tax=[Phormidium] sp. LEGE 05292 TaxID=767427 RepID=UPI0018821918|nr:2-succinyl-5-enolpyruvyl-6-hydroxy-3-cyclohexene-1-carboxylic-acid synthase [Phormidium sp. LEGE 05292]MBE9225894.1 2-succinyl-5-enolpyruvyl-6-hydroxy-3-cyclohexene-1-carboxylic-acid synthase [Phormidium sp. LEGE 05292]